MGDSTHTHTDGTKSETTRTQNKAGQPCVIREPRLSKWTICIPVKKWCVLSWLPCVTLILPHFQKVTQCGRDVHYTCSYVWCWPLNVCQLGTYFWLFCLTNLWITCLSPLQHFITFIILYPLSWTHSFPPSLFLSPLHFPLAFPLSRFLSPFSLPYCFPYIFKTFPSLTLTFLSLFYFPFTSFPFLPLSSLYHWPFPISSLSPLSIIPYILPPPTLLPPLT